MNVHELSVWSSAVCHSGAQNRFGPKSRPAGPTASVLRGPSASFLMDLWTEGEVRSGHWLFEQITDYQLAYPLSQHDQHLPRDVNRCPNLPTLRGFGGVTASLSQSGKPAEGSPISSHLSFKLLRTGPRGARMDWAHFKLDRLTSQAGCAPLIALANHAEASHRTVAVRALVLPIQYSAVIFGHHVSQFASSNFTNWCKVICEQGCSC